jgi:hypothetical protein
VNVCKRRDGKREKKRERNIHQPNLQGALKIDKREREECVLNN